MTTLSKDRFDFSEYFEASGSWLAPERCFQALIFAAGGGGGGSGGRSGDFTNPNISPGTSTGGNGGNTSVTGYFGSFEVLGGAGGAGVSASPSGGTVTGVGGNGGRGSGNGVAGKNGNPGAYFGLEYKNDSAKNRDLFLSGGAGGSSLIYGNTGEQTPAIPTAQFYHTARGGEAGSGFNGGAGGSVSGSTPIGVTAANITSNIYHAGVGGAGGSSGGVSKKVNIVPNETLTITIGSGGAGSAGGGVTGPSLGSFNGNGGGGGAGGFVAIYWNED
jgi:hypothetical protein